MPGALSAVRCGVGTAAAGCGAHAGAATACAVARAEYAVASGCTTRRPASGAPRLVAGLAGRHLALAFLLVLAAGVWLSSPGRDRRLAWRLPNSRLPPATSVSPTASASPSATDIPGAPLPTATMTETATQMPTPTSEPAASPTVDAAADLDQRATVGVDYAGGVTHRAAGHAAAGARPGKRLDHRKQPKSLRRE